MVDGQVETATTYSPYGEVLEQMGTSGTVYGFTGEQEDRATGLLYLRARYYSPGLKVFQSRDPWEGREWQPATLNYYTYAHGNPVMFIDPTGKWICTLDSYIFNPNCDEWVKDALDKLEKQGGVPGQRLVAFFERHDSDIKWSALGCVVHPPLAGRIWGIRITFNPVFPDVIHGRAATIPPQDIVINSTSINGATAQLKDVATFGHEISHLAQGFPKWFSVQAEMLSTILTYWLENELGAPHHQNGELVRIGSGAEANPQAYYPWSISDLEAFRSDPRVRVPLPLRPVSGDLPRDLLDRWGVKLFPSTRIPASGTAAGTTPTPTIPPQRAPSPPESTGTLPSPYSS